VYANEHQREIKEVRYTTIKAKPSDTALTA
jgi:hypothetical protein